MNYLRAFLVGGFICLVGQLIIDKTKLTSARILVLFVVIGCLLSSFGLYDKLVDFAGAGATVPLPGFGSLMCKGVKDEIDIDGFLGIFTGGLKAGAAGITAAIVFSFFNALVFNSKDK